MTKICLMHVFLICPECQVLEGSAGELQMVDMPGDAGLDGFWSRATMFFSDRLVLEGANVKQTVVIMGHVLVPW
jgi:hypothetical protein